MIEVNMDERKTTVRISAIQATMPPIPHNPSTIVINIIIKRATVSRTNARVVSDIPSNITASPMCEALFITHFWFNIHAIAPEIFIISNNHNWFSTLYSSGDHTE